MTEPESVNLFAFTARFSRTDLIGRRGAQNRSGTGAKSNSSVRFLCRFAASSIGVVSLIGLPGVTFSVVTLAATAAQHEMRQVVDGLRQIMGVSVRAIQDCARCSGKLVAIVVTQDIYVAGQDLDRRAQFVDEIGHRFESQTRAPCNRTDGCV
jgi:hypothetical protein